MLQYRWTPLIRLGNLFPSHAVFAKCEFLASSGSFKIRGAEWLLKHLREEGRTPPLIVPSMGNTALGAAVAAREFGFRMTGVVPRTITRAKDEKLQALGVELVKIDGGGSDLLRHATDLARQRDGYFVHPHLDPLWTDGYQFIPGEIHAVLSECQTLVFPVGGGGLLMGLLAWQRRNKSPFRLIGCEPYNYPTYAPFNHARTETVADGLLLDTPHPPVQQAIAESGCEIAVVPEKDILTATRNLYETQGLVVEPSSAITLAYVGAHAEALRGPVCVVLTGENISPEDHRQLVLHP
jgi:threonine dehydratase